MKKTVLLGLSASVLIGGYSGLWFYNANRIQHEMDFALSSFKDTLKVESSSVSGFPSAPKINLKNINFTIPEIFQIRMEQANIALGLTEKSYTVTGSDLEFLADAVKIDDKPLNLALKVAGQGYTVAFAGSQLKDFFTGQFSIHPMENKSFSSASWKNFKRYDTSFQSNELVDKNSNEVLMRTGPGSVHFSISPSKDERGTVHFKMDMKDIEYTPGSDKFIPKILMQVMKLTGNPEDANVAAMYNNFSRMGKAHYDIDVAYTGPLDIVEKQLTKQPFDFEIKIAKLDQHADIASSTMKGLVSASTNDTGVPSKIAVNLEGSTKVTQAYMDILKEQMQKTALLAPGENPEGAAALANFAEAYAVFMPDLAALGEIKIKFDFNADIDNKSFVINEISYDTDKHGLSLKANAKLAELTNPEFHMEIQIKEQEAFINALFSYAASIYQEVEKQSQAPLGIKMDDAMKTKLVEFLKSIATKNEGDSKNMHIKISMDKGQVKIGEMEGMQAMATLMALFAPAS
ncbi:MAG: hypothetical protein KBB83_04940 [Alphaproteobacteria bacterium]|nr:hypothetical protein [Alphaproteobacteria bacterium]